MTSGPEFGPGSGTIRPLIRSWPSTLAGIARPSTGGGADACCDFRDAECRPLQAASDKPMMIVDSRRIARAHRRAINPMVADRFDRSERPSVTNGTTSGMPPWRVAMIGSPAAAASKKTNPSPSSIWDGPAKTSPNR